MVKKNRNNKSRKPSGRKAIMPVEHNRPVIARFIKRTIGWFRKHTKIGAAFGSLILAFVPTFIGNYYQVSVFAEKIKVDFPNAAHFLDSYIYLCFAISFLWVFLILVLYQFLIERFCLEPVGGLETPNYILATLNNIVGAKAQRFNKALNELTNCKDAAGKTDYFSKITQPIEQLNEIVRGVYTVFDAVLREHKVVLKVNLAIIKDKKIQDIIFHYPSDHPVRSPICALNNPNSGISTAIRNGKTVVIDSILQESTKNKDTKRFVVTDAGRANEDGSLICHPITFEPVNQVVLVLSIHADKPRVFREEHKKSYAELLRPFEIRMKLEYALYSLKELHSMGKEMLNGNSN